ncbi:MAG: hypothetical protein ABIG44_12700 [Planctomycetota bacterium]
MTILRSKPRVKGNWNVIALTETDEGVGTTARVIEGYAYTRAPAVREAMKTSWPRCPSISAAS